MEQSAMREKFNNAIKQILKDKRDDNKAYLSIVEYDRKLAALKEAKTTLSTPASQKSTRHYRLIRKYDILNVHGKERLIKPMKDNSNKILYYVTNEELFDILYLTHSELNHAGRNRTVVELKNKYCNITKEAVMIFLKMCDHCQRRTAASKKRLLSKTVLQSALNSRGQVEIIDMQEQRCDGYGFVLLYQDHFTKFVVLRALKTSDFSEIATHLLDIFTIFGVPGILHSDKVEFVKAVLSEVHKQWKEVKIVYGKPKESIKKDIEEMVKNDKDWPTSLKYIQFEKNRSLHSGIGRSPYEAMFGCSARLGLGTSGIPESVLKDIKSDEDVENFFADNNVEASSSSLLETMKVEEESCEEDGIISVKVEPDLCENF